MTFSVSKVNLCEKQSICDNVTLAILILIFADLDKIILINIQTPKELKKFF